MRQILLMAIMTGSGIMQSANPLGELFGVQLPRYTVDTRLPVVTGSTLEVNDGENLQTAINSAVGGDEIVIEAGFDFTANFTLPNKGFGTDWIILRSSNESSLPSPGLRVGLGDVSNMPTIEATGTSGNIITPDANAHHYRLIGLHIKPQSTSFYTGAGIRSAWSNHDLIFDRCVIEANTNGGRRGIWMDGQRVACTDCYINNWWAADGGGDTQAILQAQVSVSLIQNTFLEASGECYMCGGTFSPEARMGSDLTFKLNHFHHPLEWWDGEPEHDGTNREIKNLFELKYGRRVLLEANLLTNGWQEEQNSLCVMKSVPESGMSAYAQTEHITWRYNKIVGCAEAIRIIHTGGLPENNFLFHDNVFYDINITRTYGTFLGRWFQFQATHKNVNILNNTAFVDEDSGVNGAMIWLDGTINDFNCLNNISGYADEGVGGSGGDEGTDRLDNNTTNYDFRGNVLFGDAAGNNSGNYPAGNFHPATLAAVGFVDHQADGTGNDRLLPTSTFKNAGTDGKDPGVDWDAFDLANAR